ncbi:MAG: 50S ribosomal protein L4 [Nanoarchaeota archaeon]|nr:50S ribosomal protein L4 [Nanoarchaeota archaeon]
MKLDIISKGSEKKGSIDLPGQFNEILREDIIKRAVEAEQSSKRQPYGASKEAGMRHSVYVSKRRHDYKATYGIGQSRTPRKVTSRSGERMNWTGAFAPQTVGGRRAHPPKSEKIWEKKINKKEKNLAIRSAISATVSKELSQKRGHIPPDNYPFIIDNTISSLKKTKEVLDFLKSIGLEKELARTEKKKIRPGKGKMRGRKYKKKKGILIVTAEDCPLLKSAKNIPGADIVKVSGLNAELLAPGTMPGRITLWTDKAVEKMSKENRFM